MNPIRRLLALGAALVLLTGAPEATAQQQTADVKQLLQSLWGRLRALTPRPAPAAGTTVTVTAGLRGAEATESELRPYWRGDERQGFDNAQALADAGKFAEAAAAFDTFLQAHPRSPLAPNALFGAGLARAALGERSRAAGAFEEFLKREPQHPLAADARQALAALR
jgi:TolA-binding protein